jgi:HipA-like protein
MQRGIVFVNGAEAGTLERTDEGKYIFRYHEAYYINRDMPGVSLTLPKNQKEYESSDLFPFFYGLLAEGVNKDIQCRLLKIDENDDFTRLLKTAGTDTIGAITIKEEMI